MLSRRLLWLLAATVTVTIANIYYAQPLLGGIAADLRVSPAAAGVLVTATQVGYGIGLVLVVPLGDIVPRRPLLCGLLLADAGALAGSALAPGLTVLAAFGALVGLTSVVVQMVVPFAATLADDSRRAGVIGTLLGALLLGVLLSRTIAGLLAGLAGWRWVYAAAAGAMLVTAVVLARVVPAAGREISVGYGAQLRAVLRLVASEPVLRWRTLVGAGQFAAFSAFWTTVTFLLSGPPYHLAVTGIGLFALVGAAGAGCALAGGRLLNARRSARWPLTGASLVLLLASFGLLAAGRDRLGALIAGAVLMDACCQAVHVANQAVIYDLVDAARSRVTTVYMTVYFLGGALGTAAGVLAYGRFGWYGACLVAAAGVVLALLAWLAGRRHEVTRVPGGLTGRP